MLKLGNRVRTDLVPKASRHCAAKKVSRVKWNFKNFRVTIGQLKSKVNFWGDEAAKKRDENRLLSLLKKSDDNFSRDQTRGGGTWVFFGWVCAARDSKLAPRSRKNFP